ncbi:hypothetical protein B0H13DRAFT_812441 [Mycena leptocephala]|nr:hypothetical protein B0H13DRAFT_812441 [Mycena leptocephala]
MCSCPPYVHCIPECRRATISIDISYRGHGQTHSAFTHSPPAGLRHLFANRVGLRRWGTDRSHAHSHQRRKRCVAHRAPQILRGWAGDERRQLEENIRTFQAPPSSAHFFLLFPTQHKNRVDYVPQWFPLSAQKSTHSRPPSANTPELQSDPDSDYFAILSRAAGQSGASLRHHRRLSRRCRRCASSVIQCAERTCTATIGSTRSTRRGSTRAQAVTSGVIP